MSDTSSSVSLDRSQAPLRRALVALAGVTGDLGDVLGSFAEAMFAFTGDRKIVVANTAAEELFGFSPGGLAGKSVDTLLPVRLRQPAAPPMTPMPDVMQVELAGARVDGSELLVEWVLGSVATPSGELYVAWVRDRAIVDRAFEDLRVSEERFRLLIDGVRDYAILMLDASGHVASWNVAAQRVKGWTSDEIIGKPYEWFFTPDDREAGVLRPDARARGAGGRARGRGLARSQGRHAISRERVADRDASIGWRAVRVRQGHARSDGEVRSGSARAAPDDRASRALCHAEAAERSLRDSEERLRRLQQVTAALSEGGDAARRRQRRRRPDPVRMLRCDRATCSMSCPPSGDTLQLLDQRGRPADAPPPETVAVTMHLPIATAVRTAEAGYFRDRDEMIATFPELRDAEALRSFQGAVALPLITHGKVIGGLAVHFVEPRVFSAIERSILSTISELFAQALERAQLFAAEQTARASAEAANRSKDEFLAILGHELRNPLAPIVTALEVLARGVFAHASLRARSNVIERQVTHLVRLVDDLLDVSQPCITQQKIQLRKERVQLAELVTRAIELAAPLFDQYGHHVDVAVPLGIELVVDATRLVQVVTNLLANAAKYTPAGRSHLDLRRGDRWSCRAARAR